MKKHLYIVLFFFTLTATGIAQSTESQLRFNKVVDPVSVEIYPNPASELVFVDIKSEKVSQPIIALYNIIGNTMKVKTELVSQSKYKLDLTTIPSGYYLISIQDEYNTSAKFTFKFLKR